MIQSLKELLVIIVIAVPIWIIIQKNLSHVLLKSDFQRRRNTWFFVTVVGFVSPNAWIYFMAVAPIVFLTAKRDSNPAALFLLLLYAIPNISTEIPFPIKLIEINHVRILELAILIPLAARLFASKIPFKWDLMDTLLWALIALAVVIFMPYESPTNSLRRLVEFIFDMALPFYVFSRISRDENSIRDCLIAWFLAGLLLAPVAIFETTRGWLLYAGLGERMGATEGGAFLLRAGNLRAQASAGHSLALGYFLAVAWCIFFFLQSLYLNRWNSIFLGLILLLGLGATFSRGPWLTAIFGTLLLILMHPRGMSGAARTLCYFAAISVLIMISPLGAVIIDYIPFLGGVDSENVDYRRRLLEVSIPIILQNPFGGNPNIISQLESLRQGQGIIDLMNGYVQIGLSYGIPGVILFISFLFVGAMRLVPIWIRCRATENKGGYLAAILISTMFASIIFIAAASYGLLTFVLAGLCVSVRQFFRVTTNSNLARPTC